jgi:hypothetical protein
LFVPDFLELLFTFGIRNITMKLRSFILILILMAGALISLPLVAQSDYYYERKEAGQLFQQSDYTGAYKKYLKLARKGDSFSQYQVSYMYLKGLGRKEDVVESLAWAVLAAQNRQKDLVKYRDTVALLVPEDKHGKASRKIDYYVRRWGNEPEAVETRDGPRGDAVHCTGSRVGNRCDAVLTAHIPELFNVDRSFGGTLAASGPDRAVYDNDADEASRKVEYKQDLTDRINTLNQKIQENQAEADKRQD